MSSPNFVSKKSPRTSNRGGIFLPIAILVAGLAIAGAIYMNRSSIDAPKPISIEQPIATKIDAYIPVDDRDHVLGDIDTAKLIIVDYSDLECPYCKLLHETLVKIYAENKESGKIAWVYRHFPLSIHSSAGTLAQASECVAELGGDDESKSFWPFIDKVFAASDPNVAPDLKQLPIYAKELGIDEKKFNECLASGRYAAKVQEGYTNSFALTGEEITPFTVFVTDGKAVPLIDATGTGLGALPYPTMKALVNQFLSK
jgi:protein-disulfide isomerase